MVEEAKPPNEDDVLSDNRLPVVVASLDNAE